MGVHKDSAVFAHASQQSSHRRGPPHPSRAPSSSLETAEPPELRSAPGDAINPTVTQRFKDLVQTKHRYKNYEEKEVVTSKIYKQKH